MAAVSTRKIKKSEKNVIFPANNFSVLLLHVKNICWGFVNLETLKHFSTQLMDTWGLSGLRVFSSCKVLASGSCKLRAHGQITVYFTFSSNVSNFRLYNIQSSVRGILVIVVGETKQLVQVNLCRAENITLGIWKPRDLVGYYRYGGYQHPTFLWRSICFCYWSYRIYGQSLGRKNFSDIVRI